MYVFRNRVYQFIKVKFTYYIVYTKLPLDLRVVTSLYLMI